uniref:Uncharacterized protein n=1 Tax=Cacopsylla melanoneura TaxID=428564 RepID=A0A8D9F9Q8_9HEMI
MQDIPRASPCQKIDKNKNNNVSKLKLLLLSLNLILNKRKEIMFAMYVSILGTCLLQYITCFNSMYRYLNSFVSTNQPKIIIIIFTINTYRKMVKLLWLK